MSLINDYLDLQDKYEKKYGEKTIVLMEVGSFFELYGIVNETMSRGRIYEISELTNLSVSKKNDKMLPVSEKNPLMAGFPNHSFDKWKDILLKNDYTIIKIEQDGHNTKEPKRKISEIISPGVNIESTCFSSNMMSVYLEEMKDHRTNRPILCLGLSIIDVTTGETTVYETSSTSDDYKYALDEIYRLIKIFTPAEIIFHSLNVSLDRENFLNYLELPDINIHYNIYLEEQYNHLLQNKFKLDILKKVYPNTGLLTPIEYIDMQMLPFALNAYIYLINFTYEHNELIIEKLNRPKILAPSNYLILSHDSIIQLNVLPDKNKHLVKGISSLWDILDKTSTPLGKRFLKDSLLNPILNINELDNRYNLIDSLQKTNINITTDKPLYRQLGDMLKNINDIERLHRKMAIKMMNPSAFISLDVSYISILQIIELIETKVEDKKILSILPDTNIIVSFKEFIEDYNSKISMDKIGGININNIRESIFKRGLYADIDECMDKINLYNEHFNSIVKNISTLIDNGNSNKQIIEVKNNDRDGHYLSLTNSRATLLKKTLEKYDKLEILLTNNEKLTIKVKDLEIKSNTGSSKITTSIMNNYSQCLLNYEQKMMSLCLEKFTLLLQYYYGNYADTLKKISSFISYLDFLTCVARVSIDNGYCRPEIVAEGYSYIEATQLRHPIIEKIQTNIQYVPNNITIGKKDNNGILLFGLNCVGKSTMMKSVGLATIMAQCGFFVPAKSFKYSPYKYLFTRISSNDNLFKGQSTFAVEMSELRSILKRSNKNSLVLGDELCSGTETTSALAIVTAGVVRLYQKEASFIFTTHLHKLADMEEIIDCKGVHAYHMETLYDEKTKKLIYNRKLQPGSGSAIYGLEVAKAMDLDEEFINTANNIRKRIMGIQHNIVDNKTSQFNSNIIISKCSICQHKTEEVHHINEQHMANNNGIIDYFHKNNLWNLVQLCHKCHQDVHHNKLIINGYVSTSDGVELSYRYTSQPHLVKNNIKTKYTEKQIELVKEIYKKTSKYSDTKRQMKVIHDVEISLDSIKKLLNNH